MFQPKIPNALTKVCKSRRSRQLFLYIHVYLQILSKRFSDKDQLANPLAQNKTTVWFQASFVVFCMLTFKYHLNIKHKEKGNDTDMRQKSTMCCKTLHIY